MHSMKKGSFVLAGVASLVLAGALGASLGGVSGVAADGEGTGFAPNQIVNGDFESGNLSGWKSYSIWKGESGMNAFRDELVVNTTYFNDYPYNRHGNYNLGIVTSGTNGWDQNAERMGHLRSSNFTLGGSGWISFKLGGGKYSSFAYVSVRKVSDNVEIARFGNRWYNNTEQATTQYGSSISNAEAFLFQYYYDLSSYIGNELYITLSDTSSYNWSILSADDFVTYYATEPSHSDDTLATNIVPSIIGAGSATNSIPGGVSTSGDDFSNYWSNVDGIWKLDGTTLKSNKNGDSDIGVIRSSAFTIDNSANNYIRWGWGGGMKFDKQVFASIKEAGSNIEKIRYSARTSLDNSNNIDNHWGLLSGLDTSKEYYIEFSDNVTDGWGVNFFNDVRLTNSSDSKVQTAGDAANIISGVPASFSYPPEQEAQAYARYFLDSTSTYCGTLNGGSSPWTEYSSNYATLTNDAKDLFAPDSTDSTISSMVARYTFMVSKYTSFENFLTNSSGSAVVTSGSNKGLLGGESDNGVITFIIGAIVISLISLLSFFILRKPKKKGSKA